MESSSLQLHLFSDPKLFLQETKPCLLRNETQSSMILGIVDSLVEDINCYGSSVVLSCAKQQNEIVIVAICTHPFPMLMACSESIQQSQIKDFVLQLSNQNIDLNFSGVLGETSVSLWFASEWASVRGLKSELRVHERLFSLNQVSPQSLKGTMRPTTSDDIPIAVQWFQEFSIEALKEECTEKSKTRFAKKVALGQVFFWISEQGVPVSMAGTPRKSPNTISIGPVYTPPTHRKNGFASMLVSALSQEKLNEGFKECILMTDLSNPTSNKIYEAIGYRRVCEMDEHGFTKLINE